VSRAAEAERAATRLRALVDAESPSGDRDRIDAALGLLDGWASAALGRRARRVTVDGVDHLLWPATRTPTTLLLGHVDTVWPAGTTDGWAFSLEGDVMRGPGIFDMKAGLVAAIDAVEHSDDPRHIALLITSDEEVGSLTSRALVESAARSASAVLVMEPSLDGALKTARSGASFYRVSLDGIEAHAGLDPGKGANALIELGHQVLALSALAAPERGTLVTPTLAKAGTSMNTVAGHAEFRVDVRAYTHDELLRVDRHFAALAPVDRRVEVSVEGGINRPPLERDQARVLVALAELVAASADLPPLGQATVGGASDGNFTAALGIPTLDGLGPRGGGAHHRSEWASLDSVLERSVLIAGMVNELAGSRATG
jgi:glutamate carboxypeptidase